MEILMILRKIAQGDDYARLYKWVSEDALFVEKKLRELLKESAEHSVHLTALRRGLAVSILFNVVLLIVFAVIIGGR
jgi:hypothetical protein